MNTSSDSVLDCAIHGALIGLAVGVILWLIVLATHASINYFMWGVIVGVVVFVLDLYRWHRGNGTRL